MYVYGTHSLVLQVFEQHEQSEDEDQVSNVALASWI